MEEVSLDELNPSPTANAAWLSPGRKRLSTFVPAKGGAVSSLSFYLDGRAASSGSQPLIAVVYSSTAGEPARLLCRSAEVVVQAGAAARWVHLAPIASCPMTAGTGYWVGLHSGGTKAVARYYFASEPAGMRQSTDAYDDGPTSTFGSARSVDRDLVADVVLVNRPPLVVLTEPGEGASFDAPATVRLSATASDPDGRVARVEFFAGETKIGEALAAPYLATWSNVQAGTHALSAVATDDLGEMAESAPVSITVRSWLPSATFSASPLSIAAGQTSTLRWETSGATSVSISPAPGAVPASGSTVVSPTSTRTYTLLATNSAGTTQRQVTVTVSGSATTYNGVNYNPAIGAYDGAFNVPGDDALKYYSNHANDLCGTDNVRSVRDIVTQGDRSYAIITLPRTSGTNACTKDCKQWYEMHAWAEGSRTVKTPLTEGTTFFIAGSVRFPNIIGYGSVWQMKNHASNSNSIGSPIATLALRPTSAGGSGYKLTFATTGGDVAGTLQQTKGEVRGANPVYLNEWIDYIIEMKLHRSSGHARVWLQIPSRGKLFPASPTDANADLFTGTTPTFVVDTSQSGDLVAPPCGWRTGMYRIEGQCQGSMTLHQTGPWQTNTWSKARERFPQ